MDVTERAAEVADEFKRWMGDCVTINAENSSPFTVTEKDVRRGDRQCNTCAIALAVEREHHGCDSAWVSFDRIYVKYPPGVVHPQTKVEYPQGLVVRYRNTPSIRAALKLNDFAGLAFPPGRYWAAKCQQRLSRKKTPPNEVVKKRSTPHRVQAVRYGTPPLRHKKAS